MKKFNDVENIYTILTILAVFLVYFAPTVISQTGDAANYNNVSVKTTVNISNSFPEVTDVRMSDPIVLDAGGTKIVECNATVRDFDGTGDINNVNATFFDENNANYTSPNDNNSHYTNASCSTYGTPTATTANYTCTFPVQYYANNGSNWNCTVVAQDNANATDNNSLLTTVDDLLALNVTPGTIDYGNLAVTDISNAQEANITNFGNVDINVSVYGYGNTTNDGLAMNCDQGNISVGNERFSLNSSLNWADMTNLTSTTSTDISNLTLTRRTNDSSISETINSTYWKLRIPQSSNPSGICNGTVVFEAISS